MSPAAAPVARDASLEQLAERLRDARSRTLAVLDEIDVQRLPVPYLTEVNPFDWEAGHVAWFQEWFTLRQPLGRDPFDASFDELLDSARVGHERRWSQRRITPPELRRYLESSRDSLLEELDRPDPQPAWLWLVQLAIAHEDMHAEAFAMMRQLLGLSAPRSGRDPAARPARAPLVEGDITVAGGPFLLGAPDDGRFAHDNERGAHEIEIAPFAIARRPVTQAELAAFVDGGGYECRELWSDEGWSWRLASGASHPVFWRRSGRDGWQRRHFDAWLPIEERLPAVHVNAHEAEAWCRWAERRLPSEAEWEAAASLDGAAKLDRPWRDASITPLPANLDGRLGDVAPVDAFPEGDAPSGCRQMLGNCWEWTASPFEPYPGFRPDPYAEYSEPWFGTRRVLRGGSWATRSRTVRATWRNFQTPNRRDPFAGFRSCAID